MVFFIVLRSHLSPTVDYLGQGAKQKKLSGAFDPALWRNFVARRPLRAYTLAMKVIVRLSEAEESKALPILLRHSPGMVLPGRTYVLYFEALTVLRNAGIQFTEISREAATPSRGEVAGERV